ncbi:MAG: oxidase [Acidobacteria bacterium]|nr:MAG: oxidase [Acidobacteriota bacterium]
MSTHSHHVPTIRMCVSVFLALLVFTAITVWVAGLDLGPLNTPVALGIAVTKGTLVVLFFMGVRWNTPLTKTVAISGFVWLLILFGITMGDYLTRGWLGVPGR